jgi:Uma2 family endonuclease
MSDALRIEDDDIEEKTRYTYADYLKWEGPERYQLINGEVYQMASPSVEHQRLLMSLSVQFGSWLKDKPCQVFASPLDVRLFPKEDDSDNTVVQPDLLVVCDKNRLSKNSVKGAPDLVVEIVSPSNTHSELFLKYNYYLEAGVREYWIIDPMAKRVNVHVYENGHFISTAYKNNASVSVTILPGLVINFGDLWSME